MQPLIPSSIRSPQNCLVLYCPTGTELHVLCQHFNAKLNPLDQQSLTIAIPRQELRQPLLSATSKKATMTHEPKPPIPVEQLNN